MFVTISVFIYIFLSLSMILFFLYTFKTLAQVIPNEEVWPNFKKLLLSGKSS